MSTIVNLIRQVIAAKDDDFFDPEVVLYYANKSKDKVVSLLIQRERLTEKSIRALDALRTSFESPNLTGTERGEYYFSSTPFPTNLLDTQYLVYDNKTPLKELVSQELYKLETGSAVPSEFQGFYYVTTVNSTRTYQLYIHESPSNKKISGFYIKDSARLNNSSVNLIDLPERLINAVVYGAAIMMVNQEGVRDPNFNPATMAQLYNEELTSNIY
jgi:hypothetical protein